jgi:hypothetical protein
MKDINDLQNRRTELWVDGFDSFRLGVLPPASEDTRLVPGRGRETEFFTIRDSGNPERFCIGGPYIHGPPTALAPSGTRPFAFRPKA